MVLNAKILGVMLSSCEHHARWNDGDGRVILDHQTIED